MRRRLTVAITMGLVLSATACGGDDGLVTEATDAAVTTVAGSSDDSMTDDSMEDVGDRLDRAGEALKDGDFSTMFQVLSLSTVGDEIEDRAVTVLAPTEEAFSALSADDVAELLSNPTEIDDLLRRHILDEPITLNALASRTEVTTIGGDSLPVTVSGTTIMIDGAEVGDVGMDDSMQDRDLVVLSIDAVLGV